MNVLFLNLLLYLCWFLFVFYREKRLTIYSFLILFFTVIAFLGCYTVENNVYFAIFGKKSVDSLDLEPYIYSFIGYVILFYPFKKITLEFDNVSVLFSGRARLFVKVWVVYFSLFTCLKLLEALISISTGLGDVYESRHVDGNTLFVYNNILLNKFNGYGSFILNATVPFIMSYTLIGMHKKFLSHKYATFLIMLSFLPSFLNGIAMGSRGGIFMSLFCFLFFILLLWKYISRNILKKIYFCVVGFITLALIYSWSITAERVGKGSEGFNSVLRYFGESFPNLGFSFWDRVIKHPMGERLFPNLFPSTGKMLSNLSVDETYQYWYNKTGVPVLNFKTYFGDLYIEFGTLYAFLFIVIFSLIMKKCLSRNSVTLCNLPFLYYYYQLCVFSFAGFTKGGHHAFFQLLIVIIFSVCLRFYLTNKIKTTS